MPSNCTAVEFVDVFFGLPTVRAICRQEMKKLQLLVDKIVDKQEDTALALLLNLSSNNLKQAQSNAVVVQQKEMDRVGFEPTTSAFLCYTVIK
ncbi:MAG: hypothetical protein M3299_03570 [Thermoproteota archaeon]|nr:hypothetical protein [Thermoproteota archaeon]